MNLQIDEFLVLWFRFLNDIFLVEDLLEADLLGAFPVQQRVDLGIGQVGIIPKHAAHSKEIKQLSNERCLNKDEMSF